MFSLSLMHMHVVFFALSLLIGSLYKKECLKRHALILMVMPQKSLRKKLTFCSSNLPFAERISAKDQNRPQMVGFMCPFGPFFYSKGHRGDFLISI